MTSFRPLPARLALAGAMIALTTGCFSGWGRSQNPFNQSDGTPGEVQVLIENLNFNDANIYVLRGGERVRLGDVTGKSDERFTVRWDFTLNMEFEISMIGSGGCRTRPMSVAPGDAVWVRIPVNISATECQIGK